jgi:hypothetical protein
MQPGFQNLTLDVCTGDGLNDTLLEPLDFLHPNGTLYRAPAGATTDGLSVPRCVQNIIPATGGDWFSGVLHDAAYRNQLQVWLSEPTTMDGGRWVLANLTQLESDNLILTAMGMQGVGFVMRHTIYRALRLFGSKAFKDDRKPSA